MRISPDCDVANRRSRPNRLLAAVPDAERALLAGQLEPVELRYRQVLLARDQPITHVVFPETAVCSLVTVMSDGNAAESGTVGFEGLGGVEVVLGSGTACCDLIVQVPGRALRMTASDFTGHIHRSPLVRALVDFYIHALLVQSLQSTACNRLHSLAQRCCRWLLMTQDRVDADEFRLTHDVLAVMVGVRRPSVTTLLSELEEDGLVRGRRGCIRIANRDGLEARACECYEVIRHSLDGLTGSLASVRQRTDPAVATR